MFKNYLKIALRSIWRNKVFSSINILGLAIGLATCMLIMLYVQNELSYDRYNTKADQIVRVVFKGQVQGQKMKEANVMPPVAKTLQNDYAEVEQATRLMTAGTPAIVYGDHAFTDEPLAFVDSNFLDVFTLPLVQGNKKTVLQQPNSIVITTDAAHKFFGNENAIGKTLFLKNAGTIFMVTGVIKPVPVNSHFRFSLFASMAAVPDAESGSWMTSGFFTYLVLQKGYDFHKLQAKLPQVVEKYMGPPLKQSMGISLAMFRKQGNDIGFLLQPLTDIHLHSDFTGDLAAYGDIRYVYIFSAVAVFMLLIACINFINLSTAGASKRAREVGIRKVLGSRKGQLVRQFMMESLVITGVALLLALIIVRVALPYFSRLSGIELSMNFLSDPLLLAALLLLVAITGLLAGSYPAFYLSAFNPVSVIKGKFFGGKQSKWLRRGLVVFQFFISITLIVGTLVVFRQLSYINNIQLGYDKNNVLILPDTGLSGDKAALLRQQIAADSRVENVTSSGYIPVGPSYGNNFFLHPQTNASQIKTLRYDVEYNYLATLGMQLAYGRNFSKVFATDSSGIILNETAVRAFGWSNDALNKTLTHFDNRGAATTYHVIGVIKDFHFKSLHERISPLVMTLSTTNSTLIVKANTTDISGLLSSVKQHWQAINPDAPFTYSFLDDRYANAYKSEANTGYILAIFAGLTIFIACLGLFGLATFTANQRTKEIGVRKVLGASVKSIVLLLSGDFLKLVCLAFVIAAPVSWYIMSKWLQDFAYRTPMGWQIYLFAAVIAVCIAIATISVQAIKAAIANPVKSLRTE